MKMMYPQICRAVYRAKRVRLTIIIFQSYFKTSYLIYKESTLTYLSIIYVAA